MNYKMQMIKRLKKMMSALQITEPSYESIPVDTFKDLFKKEQECVEK